MSRSVDSRVVELDFDNKKFEEGTRESIKSLDAMKKGLDFDESTRSIGELSRASSGFSLSKMGEGIQAISSRFSAMGVVGFTIIRNLTSAAINFGRKMVTRIMGPMKEGFMEYETQMNAIQTVLANTSKAGTTLEDVSAALDELNTYADLTIYNFTEMTRNIGTFTAAGVDLETSTAAIKGIANLAAVSGSNSQQASTAMYQLSQALSSGTVKLMDWNSVVNAGMGGQVFQDALMETARVSGVAIDSLIDQHGSFRETLQTGWLSSEVLLETLKKFTGDLSAEQLETMGYTEEQIAGIIKLGETANDAATKVKTFSQLKETLAEAVGSGWTKTWEIILGDFEEAKELFTRISDTLGTMIGEGADARNALLESWKGLGGRDNLIQSLFNSFDALLGIMNPIKAAFADVFPGVGDAKLAFLIGFTRALEAITEAVSSGIIDNADNIQRVFAGIFSVFKIGIEIVSNLARVISTLLGENVSVNVDASPIVTALVQIGDFLVNFAKNVDIEGTFTNTLEYLRVAIARIKEEVALMIAIVKVEFEKTKETLSAIFGDIDLTPIKDFFSGFKVQFRPFEALVKATTFIITSILKAARAVIPSMFKASTAIYEFVSGIGSMITDALANFDFAEMFSTINAGLVGGILLAIKSFIVDGSGVVGELEGVFGGISGILDGVRESFEAWQQNLRSKTLLNIAIAIGILAVALISLTLIPTKKLVDVMGILTGMFVQLIAAQAAYSKIGGMGLGAGGGLIAMAAALLIMAGVISVLAGIDLKTTTNALGTIYALQVGMVLFAKFIGKNAAGLASASLGMISVAVAMLVLSLVVKQLGAMNPEVLKQGLISVGVMLAEIALFMRFIDGKGVGKSVGLLAIAAAIGILSFVIEKIGKMDIEVLKQGLKTVGAVLTGLAIFSRASGGGADLIATAAGVVILGLALEIFVDVLQKLGSMDPTELSRGLTGMGLALLIIAAAMQALPKNMILQAVGLAIVGGAMYLIAEAVTTMGTMSWDEIARGLVVMAGALAILILALYAMSGTLLGSVALVAAAAGLLMLTPVLVTLGSMPLQEIGYALLALAGVFLVLGVAGLLLTPVVPTLLALGTAMLSIGAGVALLGQGLLSFSLGLMAIAAGGSVAAVGIAAFVTTLLGLLPVIIRLLIDTLIVFAKGIARAAPEVAKAISALFIGFLQVIIDVAPKLFEALDVLLTGLIELIAEHVPDFIAVVALVLISMLEEIALNMPAFVQAGFDILIAFLTGVRDNIAEVVTLVAEIVVEFMGAITLALPDIINSGMGLMVAFIDGVAAGVEENMESLLEAIGRLAAAIIEGLATGITAGLGQITGAILSLASSAWESVKEFFDAKSPSRKFIWLGEMLMLGFTKGIQQNKDGAVRSVEDFGKEGVGVMSDTMRLIAGLLGEDMSLRPTITPVVDLTDIRSAGSLVDELFGNTALNLTPTLATASSISRGVLMPRSIEEGRAIVHEGAQITFEQTNNSPTPLSRVEIYRQTRNQLLQVKGLV